MKKRMMALVLTFGLAAVPAMAEDYPTYAGKKLGRGLANTAFGWSELPARQARAYDEHGLGASLTWGLLDGLGNAVKRTGIGIYEMATFPVKTSDNADTLMEPEWALGTDRAGYRPKDHKF